MSKSDYDQLEVLKQQQARREVEELEELLRETTDELIRRGITVPDYKTLH